MGCFFFFFLESTLHRETIPVLMKGIFVSAVPTVTAGWAQLMGHGATERLMAGSKKTDGL